MVFCKVHSGSLSGPSHGHSSVKSIQEQDRISHRIRREQCQLNDQLRGGITRERDNSSQLLRRENFRIHDQEAYEALCSQRAIVQSNYLRRPKVTSSFKLARGFQNLPSTFQLSSMTSICRACGAKHFTEEMTRKDKFIFSSCCGKGKVFIDLPHPHPPHLDILFPQVEKENQVEIEQLLPMNLRSTPIEELKSHFMNHIRHYNGALAFASICANVDLLQGRGPSTYRVHGQIYHYISPSIPQLDEGRYSPSFGQLYFIDTEEAVNLQLSNAQRSGKSINLNDGLMKMLNDTIREINPYAIQYLHMADVVARHLEEGVSIPSLELAFAQNGQPRVRNLGVPVASEIASVFPEGVGNDSAHEFVVHMVGQEGSNVSNNNLIRLPAINAAVDPLCYPLLFPYGDHGWSVNMRTTRDGNEHKITMREFYAYRIADRGTRNIIILAGKLFQQYIVDSYIKIERTMLDFQRSHQKQLRVETYSGLADYVTEQSGIRNIIPGTVVILSSSFIGGPRHKHEIYQDALAVVRKMGRPDLFITFTCNPCWPEIKTQLLPGQHPSDRPDLIAKVFKLKLAEFMKDIYKKGVFGKAIAFNSVIEFQKRGLPHCHLLLILSHEDQIVEQCDIDATVSAEIPNKLLYPDLYSKVKQLMIHGPCGDLNPRSPCMVTRGNKSVCSKGFPKQKEDETSIVGNSFPIYRRRCENSVVRRGVPLSDDWVVPYNPFLLSKYNAHINVELCASVKSYKYIYKYICKSSDHALVEVRRGDTNGGVVLNHDEIESYVKSRYISSAEASWRIFSYPLTDRSHSIVRLCVHLPHEQRVVFEVGQESQALQRESRDTKLTAWFTLNQNCDKAKSLKYQEIPEHYIFEEKNRRWVMRKRKTSNVIGRIYTVSPKDGERFYLRMLLLYVQGATSYEDLRTVDSKLVSTFREACILRELVENDEEWRYCLSEAVQWQMPHQLRHLFVTIIVWCNVLDVSNLFDQFKYDFSEDFLHRLPSHLSEDFQSQIASTQAYREIDTMLRDLGHKGMLSMGISPPLEDVSNIPLSINMDLNTAGFSFQNHGLPLLNSDQRRVHDDVLDAVENPNSDKLFFVDGPGGTGKTFLYGVIVHTMKLQGISVLCVSWTGISAMLLPEGTTLHSRFKLPLEITTTTTLGIRGQSIEADTIRKARVILWDEAPMAPAIALDAVDRGLRDLHQTNEPFGGKIVLLGGDFRQVLPVVPKGSRKEEVAAGIQNSIIWPLFNIRRLSKNMRTNKEELEFAKWLLKVGNGDLTPLVEIPKECLIQQSLIDQVFGSKIRVEDIEALRSTVILTPKNVDCQAINDATNDRLEGAYHEYRSVDTIDEDESDKVLYPIEFLNTITLPGIPPHILKLKVGSIVMLLRNLDLKRGLCNGVRMVVRKLLPHVIEVELITGENVGYRVFIPRIKLLPVTSQIPFKFVRRQFPLQLAFSITINKAQGQTFDRVGISLLKPVFTHGQLYVALSRVRSKNSLFVKLPEGCTSTPNIVYREVIQGRSNLCEQTNCEDSSIQPNLEERQSGQDEEEIYYDDVFVDDENDLDDFLGVYDFD